MVAIICFLSFSGIYVNAQQIVLDSGTTILNLEIEKDRLTITYFQESNGDKIFKEYLNGILDASVILKSNDSKNIYVTTYGKQRDIKTEVLKISDYIKVEKANKDSNIFSPRAMTYKGAVSFRNDSGFTYGYKAYYNLDNVKQGTVLIK